MILYLLLSLIYLSDSLIYTTLNKKNKKLMKDLTELHDFVTKIVTTQNLDAIVEEKKAVISTELTAKFDEDFNKLADKVNAITDQLNKL